MSLIPNPLVIPVGLIMGILVAAPVGPVNVLCIQRAIERGFWGGVAAGAGAVLGDGLIALSAALGVGAISGAIEHYRTAIQIVGGLALIAFGIKLSHTAPRLRPAGQVGRVSLRDYVNEVPQTFFLTITNPGAVLGLVWIFGAVSTFVGVQSPIDAVTMVAAVMAGSLAWWIGLSHFISRLRHQISGERLAVINRVAGLLLVAFGAILVGEMVVMKFV